MNRSFASVEEERLLKVRRIRKHLQRVYWGQDISSNMYNLVHTQAAK